MDGGARICHALEDLELLDLCMTQRAQKACAEWRIKLAGGELIKSMCAWYGVDRDLNT